MLRLTLVLVEEKRGKYGCFKHYVTQSKSLQNKQINTNRDKQRHIHKYHFKTTFIFFNGKSGHRGPTQPASRKIPLTFFLKPSLIGWVDNRKRASQKELA